MSFYADPSFFVLLCVAVVGAAVLGLLEKPLKWYGLIASLFFVVLLFMNDVRQLACFVLFLASSAAGCALLMRAPKSKWRFRIALALTLYSLVVCKVSGAFDASLLGFVGISYLTFKATQIVIEVHDGIIEPFEGGFSAYIMQRVERDRVARVTEERRQNKIRRELAWLSRGAQARSTKPKFRIKAAQDLIADVPPLRNSLELQRMAVARLGKECVDLENVAVSYDDSDKLVFHDVTWNIGPGDRVGILGENGAGKTTLLRTIEGLITPVRGRVKIGKTVKFAVLSQHLDNLTKLGNDRVRQVVGRYTTRVMLDGKEQTPGDLLERLGFTKADLNEPVCDLSGGQKRRLALMMILLDQPNVLILDEPGNDLDVDMLAAVEDLLDGWPGTLILVTHDRYLMERVTDNQYALIGGVVRHLPGGVDEYLRLEAEHHGAVRQAKEMAKAASDAAKPAGGGLSNNEMRALKKQVASTERKMRTLEGKIEDAKQAMFDIDPTDFVKLGEAQQKIDDLKAQLEELEMEWLEASEQLEG